MKTPAMDDLDTLPDTTLQTRISGTFRRWACYWIVLPLLWILASRLAFQHSGDEPHLLGVAILPAAWMILILDGTSTAVHLYFVAGLITLAVAGWIMDRVRIWWSVMIPLYLITTIILVGYSLVPTPTTEMAVPEHRSLTASIAWASNISLYLWTATALGLSGLVRVGPVALRWASYRLVLPGLWFVVSLVSWNHPGDEYVLFVFGVLPAGWIAPLLNYTHLREVIPYILAAGVITMGILGWMLDRARVWWSAMIPLVLVVATALVWNALASYPSYQRAMAKNGSLTAYVASATNVSLYLSTATVLILVGLVRVGGVIMRRVRPTAEL